jgi:hypothetical protein
MSGWGDRTDLSPVTSHQRLLILKQPQIQRYFRSLSSKKAYNSRRKCFPRKREHAMANAEKQTLLAIAKYAEIVSAHLADYHDRLELVEAMILKRPELSEAYHQATKEKQKVFSPGPQMQLRAIRQAIERLSD